MSKIIKKSYVIPIMSLVAVFLMAAFGPAPEQAKYSHQPSTREIYQLIHKVSNCSTCNCLEEFGDSILSYKEDHSGYGYDGYGCGNYGYGYDGYGCSNYGYGYDGYGYGNYGYGYDGYGCSNYGYGYDYGNYGYGYDGYGYDGYGYGNYGYGYGYGNYGYGYDDYGHNNGYGYDNGYGNSDCSYGYGYGYEGGFGRAPSSLKQQLKTLFLEKNSQLGCRVD